MTAEPKEHLPGTLIAVEGLDGSGKSTQVHLVHRWFQSKGYRVFFSEWNSSVLVREATRKGKKRQLLTPTAFSLIHATDFYDQLENRIVPSLRAGFVVLADRYIYTLIARAIVRGAEPEWVAAVYAMALVPDAVFYMTISFTTLVQRTFQGHTELDYWESGMDCGLSRDWFQSFVRYQRRIRSEFFKMQKKYAFELVNANRSIAGVDRDLRARIQLVLDRTEKPEERRVRRARAR